MRRLVAVLSAVVLAIVSFAISFYLFFPKETALAYVWNKATLALAQNGLGLESAAMMAEESPLRVVVRGARLSAPIASAEAALVTLTPHIMESLLSLSLKGSFQMESLSLSLPLPGQGPLLLSSFAGTIKLRPPLLFLEGVQTAGDLEITGDFVINLGTQKIEEADMSISGQRADLLEMGKSMLPITKEASGEWTLMRKRGESK